MTQLMLEIVGVWLAAILVGFPLFASMGLAAFAFVQFGGLSGSIVPQKMAQAMNSFPLVAAPLFILMGNILGAARLNLAAGRNGSDSKHRLGNASRCCRGFANKVRVNQGFEVGKAALNGDALDLPRQRRTPRTVF